MVRRSFRIGLRLGLLFGVTFAVVKTVQSRRRGGAVPPPAPWEPLTETEREAPPVDEVGEPIMEPAAPEAEIVTEPALEVEAAVLVSPDETDLLHATTVPADDVAEPGLDVLDVPADVPAEAATPAKKVAAKKLPAARKAAVPRKATKKAAKNIATLPAFVTPEAGVCPPTHPVKAKLASRLFHLPGMFAYDRTRADRCYLDGATAVADGFVQAKR